MDFAMNGMQLMCRKGYAALAAVTDPTKPVPILLVMSLWLIWRSGVRFSNELQWLDLDIGHQDSSSINGH